jgi:hypothetical protein
VAAPPVVAEPPAPAEPPVAATPDPATPPDTPPAEPPKDDTPPPASPVDTSESKPAAEEAKVVEQQIQDFVANNPALNGSTGAGVETTPAPTTTSIPVVDTSAPAPPLSQDALSNPTPATAAPESSNNLEGPSHKKLVLTPTENALAPSVDLNALLEKENQKESTDQPVETPATNTVITPATEAGDGTNPNDISL